MSKIVIVLLMLFLLCGCEEYDKETYLGEGEVESVEYLQGNYSQLPNTIIRFTDGSTCIIYKIHSIPSGYVRVFAKNGAYNVPTVPRFENIIVVEDK